MNYDNNKGFEYNGTRYYMEEQDQFYFLYVWYEGQKILSKPIIKARIIYLKELYGNRGFFSSLSLKAGEYAVSLLKRAVDDIESKINQIRVNQLLYKNAMERKSWEQNENEKIWKKSVNK